MSNENQKCPHCHDGLIVADVQDCLETYACQVCKGTGFVSRSVEKSPAAGREPQNMTTMQSYVHQREKESAKKDEPIRGEWRGKFVFTITYLSRLDDTFHALDFYIADKRVNSYRVTLDGKPWRKRISATDALVWLRKKLPRFRLHS